LRQALLVPLHGAQQAGHLVAEGHRNGLLQVAAADHRRVAVFAGQLGQASASAARSASTSASASRICSTVAVSVMSCVVAPQWQYSPSLSRHSCVDLRDHAQHRVADAFGLLAQLVHVDVVESSSG
jgi:hypothetical protein